MLGAFCVDKQVLLDKFCVDKQVLLNEFCGDKQVLLDGFVLISKYCYAFCVDM